ncbi:MAG: SIMPL domain-containing protein [Patescibacteria group bacterium]|jgi:hypothetical protein
MPKESSGGFWPQWSENKLFALLLAIFLVYGIVYTGVLIRKSLAETNRIGVADRQPPSISVSATDTASVAPDVATVDLGVSNTASTPDKAGFDNASKANAIIAAVKALGVDAKDIQTSNYSVNPSYDYDVSPARVVGYDANETLTVKIRNTDIAGSVLAKVLSLGATNISGLRYTVEEPAAVEAEARKNAIAKAYEQAAAIATAMHARLGGVISYSEYDNSPSPYPYAFDSMKAMGGAGEAPSLQPGQTEVSKTVQIEFAIE